MKLFFIWLRDTAIADFLTAISGSPTNGCVAYTNLPCSNTNKLWEAAAQANANLRQSTLIKK